MIKKSPRLHQNYMQAYRDRESILNQELVNKSELSQQLEDIYRFTMDLPVIKMVARVEELLLQVRAAENMDEIKFGKSGSYDFARTAFPRLDVQGQHMRIYIDNPEEAETGLKLEMQKIIRRNTQLLEMDEHYQVLKEMYAGQNQLEEIN